MSSVSVPPDREAVTSEPRKTSRTAGSASTADGTPAEVLATPAVREVFLGTEVTASLSGGTLTEDLSLGDPS